MSPAEFYRRSGIGRGILSQPNYIVEDNLIKFFDVFPEVSPAWLVLGIGEPTQTFSTTREALPNISASTSVVQESVEPYGGEKMDHLADEVRRLEEQKAKLMETKMQMLEEHMAMMDEKVRLMEKVIDLQKRLLADMGVPDKTAENRSTAKPKKRPQAIKWGAKVRNRYVGGLVGQPVDLGLSVDWASWNIGASKPGDEGEHFAWGETEPGNEFSWAEYSHVMHDEKKERELKESLSWDDDEAREYFDEMWRHMHYYTFDDGQTDCDWYDDDGNFIGDGKTRLGKFDDAADANWGWRLPTAAEVEELVKKCMWEWKGFGEYDKDSCAGFLVTGPSGKSIFLPAAGSDGGRLESEYDTFCPGVGGQYWTSELGEDVSQEARALQFSHGGLVGLTTAERCIGLSIRPVIKVLRVTV